MCSSYATDATALKWPAQQGAVTAERSTRSAQSSSELKLKAQRSKPKAQSSKTNAQRPTLKAQSPKLNVQAQSPAPSPAPKAQRPNPKAQRSTNSPLHKPLDTAQMSLGEPPDECRIAERRLLLRKHHVERFGEHRRHPGGTGEREAPANRAVVRDARRRGDLIDE